jgi:protein-tyrosine phosphatase
MFDQLSLELINPLISFERNTRRLDFVGAKNFRDLGGYQTTSGRTIRWRMLYRSDQLSKLTDADVRYLNELSIDRVIDFRADHECKEEPDRLPHSPDVHYVRIPILEASTRLWLELGGDLLKKLHAYSPSEYLTKANIELATRFTPEIRQFIHEVFAAQGRPVLFHCAAGKDRTGFAAAVLLRILGVPLDVVMEDYLLSNEYYLSGHQWTLAMIRMAKGRRTAQAIKGFLEVRPVYLAAAFDAIDREYGWFERYVRNGLELTQNDIDHLRAVYLE